MSTSLAADPITSAGDRLSDALDSMNVEFFWLVHEHVNWETGEPDCGTDYTGPGTHKHCSEGAGHLPPSFTGAWADSAGNAQYAWLASDAGVAESHNGGYVLPGLLHWRDC